MHTDFGASFVSHSSQAYCHTMLDGCRAFDRQADRLSIRNRLTMEWNVQKYSCVILHC